MIDVDIGIMERKINKNVTRLESIKMINWIFPMGNAA